MSNIDYIQAKFQEVFTSDSQVALTPKRLKALTSYLKNSLSVILLNTGRYDSEIQEKIYHFTQKDLEDVGEIEFVLSHLFPSGEVPKELSEYNEFVLQVKHKYGDEYNKTVDKKLRQDRLIFSRNRDKLSCTTEFESPLYARMLVNIYDADKVPEKNSAIVLFDGETLGEFDLPDEVFSGIPKGTKVYFNYTSQGLTLDLRKTLEEGKTVTKDIGELEKIVIESLAKDPSTIGYRDSLYDQLNSK